MLVLHRPRAWRPDASDNQFNILISLLKPRIANLPSCSLADPELPGRSANQTAMSTTPAAVHCMLGGTSEEYCTCFGTGHIAEGKVHFTMRKRKLSPQIEKQGPTRPAVPPPYILAFGPF